MYQGGFDIQRRRESSPDFWIQQIRGEKGLLNILLLLMFLKFCTRFLSAETHSWKPIKHEIDHLLCLTTFTGEQDSEIPRVYVESFVMGDGDSCHNGNSLGKWR